MRNKNFDSLKGALILLVVIGHVLLGALGSNTLRDIIYFFHMPLFLAVTGYFISNKTLAFTYVELSHKYWIRVVIPYIVALLVYSISIALMSKITGDWYLLIDRNELPMIAAYLLYPYYHLWFIPAMLLYIVFIKSVYSSQLLKVISFIVSFAFCVLYMTKVSLFNSDSVANVMMLLGDKRYYSYYFYFFLGHILALNSSFKFIKVVLLVFFVSPLGYIFNSNMVVRGIFNVISNSCLIYGVFYLVSSSRQLEVSILSRIGRVTLPIYLWHVLPIIAAKKLILPYGELPYYAATFILMCSLVFFFVKAEGKFQILERLFYGNQK